jgi:hypothetical protein
VTPTPAHNGPYGELTADAARDLRRPIAPDEVRFKVQAVRWTKRDGSDRIATAAQVVAYIDARTVVARLNLLFPGRWHAPTDALPLDMRLTRRGADGALTPIRVTDQGEVKADDTLYYRCRLQIGDAAFEDVGAGDDPKAAYSDAIKRAAVRAGIGESLYAMDTPWLRIGDAEHQLRVTRAGKPYLDERTTRWLRGMYQAWLTRAGAIFGEPLPHAPAPTLPHASETPTDDSQTGEPDADADADARDGNLTAVTPPEIPDIPDAPATSDGPADENGPAADTQTSDAVRRMAVAAQSTGVTARTLNRLAVLLAARAPETVLKLEDLDDKLAAELARRVGQARSVGWDDDTLAGMVEKALRSERHRTPAQRRKAFRDHLDRLATDAQAHAEQHTPEAA